MIRVTVHTEQRSDVIPLPLSWGQYRLVLTDFLHFAPCKPPPRHRSSTRLFTTVCGGSLAGQTSGRRNMRSETTSGASEGDARRPAAAVAVGSPGGTTATSASNSSSIASRGSPTPPQPPPQTVDARLRFLVAADAPAAAALEAGFAQFTAAGLRRQRDACFASVCGVYATAMIISAATGTWQDADFAYLVPVGVNFVLLALSRDAPAWVCNHGTSVAVAATLLVFDIHNDAAGACGTGRYMFLTLYAAMPLACGAMFMPPLVVYGVVCLAHAARAVVMLSPLGPLPVFVVCAACFLGTALVHLQQWRARELFVRTRPELLRRMRSRVRGDGRFCDNHAVHAGRPANAPGGS
jgi:hypothetical protein